VIADPMVRNEQANLVRYGLTDKSFQSLPLHVADDAGDYVALALDCTSDDCLTGPGGARSAVASDLEAETSKELVHI
jgi:hypothetical protein